MSTEVPAAPADPERSGRARDDQAPTLEMPAVALPQAQLAARPTQTLPSTRKSAGPLAVVALDRVLDDDAFRLRPTTDVEALAKSIAQLGQLFPVDLRLRRPNRYQVVSGFRRVAAARLLNRPRVLARVHPDLSDEDALLVAITALCERVPRDPAAIAAAKDKLDNDGRLFPLARDILDRSLGPPEPTEGGEPAAMGTPDAPQQEVDLDELCDDLVARLSAVNQDLAAVAELWVDVDSERRATLLEQLDYPAQLAAFLERQS